MKVNVGRKGVFMSYDEKYGSIEDAIKISNERGCVTVFSKASANLKNWDVPSDIILRVKRDERYYRGLLLGIARKENLPPAFEEQEGNHRPDCWAGSNPDGYRTALFVSHLVEILKPSEIPEGGPERFVGFELSSKRAQAWEILAS